MELGAVFLLLAVFVLVGIYLYAPFLMQNGSRRAQDETYEVSALLAERDRVITALQELDFDYNLGKIPAEDYPAQRTALLQKGAEILRKLDEIAPASSSGRDAEARIEKAASAHRADASAQAASLSEDEIESMLSARRKQLKEKSAGFCPRCGKPILVTDRFCPSCGKSLS